MESYPNGVSNLGGPARKPFIQGSEWGGPGRPVPETMKARDLSRSRNEKVRELYDHLVEGVKRMLSEGELAEFLKFMARFRRYSPANMALIFA